MSDETTAEVELHKILVVDDEPDLETLVRQRMRREIRRGVYEFEFASNGEEALEKLQAIKDLDIVLTDINMPRMDGLTLLSNLEGVNRDLRSVVISAYGDMKNIRQAMNLGAFDFIVKPVDFTDLRVTIERTVKNLDSWREAIAARNQLASLQSELEVAATMQQSILPREFPASPTYRIHAHMEAAREVGGDFYDVFQLDDGRIGMAIADVSGKGVPAALFMMVSRTLLKATAAEYSDPAVVVKNVNDVLTTDNESMMFVTLIYAIYDPNTRKLSYCNGGHNPFLVVSSEGKSELHDPHDGVALGVAENFEFVAHEVEINDGETVVLYTDGVNEAEDRAGTLFGMERFEGLFTTGFKDAQLATNAVFKGVRGFVDHHSQSDDITCLTLCVGATD